MLHTKTLHDDTKQFQDIEWLIDGTTESKNIADIIAKYRQEMMDVLKSEEAETNDRNDDETKLSSLKNKLEEKKTALEEHLWTMGPVDFSDNDAIKNFWEWVLDGTKLTGLDASDTQKHSLEWKINEALTKIQFLHDNWRWTQIKDFKLFKWNSTNITDFEETLKDKVIKEVLEETNPGNVAAKVDTFVNSINSSKDNAFYIEKNKLFNIEQWKIAMRIALYLYFAKKILKDGMLTEDLYNEMIDTIENQIIKEEIPKIKWLHNTKKELWYITPEYETLRDLNIKQWDIELWDKDITAWLSEIQELTPNFENWIATWIERYEINSNTISITDAEWNILPVTLSEPSGRNLPILFSNIRDGEKSADMHVTIGWNNIKIGQLILDNTEWDAKLHIKLDDFTTISWRATTAWVTLPNFPFSLDLPVKWIKNVKNDLHWCKASLTKHYKATIITWTTPVPPPPPPVTVDDLEINAVVSDMWPDVLKEKIALDVEEELKKEYKEIVAWNVFKRAYFFLSRWKIREKRIREKMNSIQWKAFTWDSIIDDQIWNAADRHQLEKENALNTDINDIIRAYENRHINELCKKFLEWSVNENQFQNEFNRILESDTALQGELEHANISHMWTNLLIRMKQKKEWKTLINVVETHINHYTSWTWTDSDIDNINTAIQNYIKQYQDNSQELLNVYNDYLNDKTNPAKLEDLKRYLSHQKAVMSLSTNNIKIKLDIIKWWKSAYQINNSERENSWKYKLWHWMDKHPRRTTWISIWASIWLWAIWLIPWVGAVAWAAITTAWFAGLVWTTNAVKKWTHHTKEQNTHEKNLVTDYAAEQTRIRNWQNMRRNWNLLQRHKAKRQIALYHQTTQDNIQKSNIITDEINDIASKVKILEVSEINDLKAQLIEWWARLKYYKEIWHNFLASDHKTKTEEDMNRLEKALFLWIWRLWDANLTDIEGYTVTVLWKTRSFTDVYNELQNNFETSNRKFEKERRKLSIKYGVWTALASTIFALGMQYFTWSGIFAKWTSWTPAYHSTKSLTDNFDLWKHQLLDTWLQNDIYNWTKSVLTWAPNWSTLNINYGAGTDATVFLPWRTPTASNLATKVTEVTHNISGMSWLTATDKAKFISEVTWLWWWTGTNWVLQNMRQAEFLEQAARALSDSWMSWNVNVSLLHDAWLDVVWTHTHNVWERVVNGIIEVTKNATDWKPPVKRGRWIMGMPLFFNTFKDKQEP